MNMRWSDPMSRRTALAVALSAIAFGTSPVLAATSTKLKVWKDPNCGCCTGWIQHLRHNGFIVEAIETSDMQTVKRAKGVPSELASCHTAEVGPYTIEGHVPAHAIERLLRERPSIAGLAVPGMPIGSPGMEGGKPEEYSVIGFQGDVVMVYGRYLLDRPI